MNLFDVAARLAPWVLLTALAVSDVRAGRRPWTPAVVGTIVLAVSLVMVIVGFVVGDGTVLLWGTLGLSGAAALGGVHAVLCREADRRAALGTGWGPQNEPRA